MSVIYNPSSSSSASPLLSCYCFLAILNRNSTHQPISSHVKDQYLGRADSPEVIEAGDDAGVQHPQPVAAVGSHAVDRDESRTVDVPAPGRVPRPVGVGLRGGRRLI